MAQSGSGKASTGGHDSNPADSDPPAGAGDGKDTAEAAKPAATVLIELQRTLTGWGERNQIIEVEHTAEVDGLIANEHAVRVAKKDVTATADGGLVLTTDLAGS